ncbi:nuclear transport factor 2 family protein [Mycobacterium sp. TNTM28]|uniref:Nuclear transport factor 2 family protein n=1 Tax=[Mycobacterium] fortunisiensis TaxID=2600579 RepID=A0ABS6KIN3_9MYCO|nr:nuclear transport factor 2 family protein [[Mycobacterium] fortunisiensis]MBU9763424.1 nuclear transport factor 2 family protein [[Mycobacterium] fortunisiensis]
MSEEAAAVRELISAYALSLDADEIENCLSLFTSDAEFEVYGRVFTGPDGIREMFTNAPRGLHMTGASQIDVDGGFATARSQILFVEAGTSNLRPALYDDELVNVGGHWRFRRRRCQFITASGLSARPQNPA